MQNPPRDIKTGAIREIAHHPGNRFGFLGDQDQPTPAKPTFLLVLILPHNSQFLVPVLAVGDVHLMVKTVKISL